MSALEPPGAAELTPGTSRFPIVRRGYDRDRVDGVVRKLAEQLEQQRQKTEEAIQAFDQLERQVRVRQQVPPSFADLGAEAAKVLEHAGTVAETLIGEAADRAQRIVEAADARADEVVGAAREQAAQIEQAGEQKVAAAEAEGARLTADAAEAAERVRTAAEREAKAVLSAALDEAGLARRQAESERLLVEAQTDRLQTLREVTVEQLRRMQTQLGLALLETATELEPEFEATVNGDLERSEPADPASGAVAALEAAREADPSEQWDGLDDEPAGIPRS